MVFWIAVVLYWCGYTVLMMGQGAAYLGWTSGMVLIGVLFAAGGIGAAAWLRWRVLRHHWLGMPAAALGLRMVAFVVLGAVLIQIAGALVLRPALWAGWVQLPGNRDADYRWSSIVQYWLNTVVILGLWSAGWLAVQWQRRHRQAELDRQQESTLRQHLELDVLRGRLNPHFVFNALNNLRALILEDPQRARELVTRLSATLRRALEHLPQGPVTLAAEWAVVQDYLAVEAVHFEDRLQVDAALEASALTAWVPAMVLQLLVENAIKHGIAVTPGGGRLQIRAQRVADGLLIEVRNPGALRNTQREHGIGLRFLRAQLQRWTPGAAFSLTREDDGVLARVSIPQEAAA